MEIIVVLSIIFTFVAFGAFFYQTNKIIKEISAEKKDLLNRLMAKDLREYAMVDISVKEAELRAKDILSDNRQDDRIFQNEQDVYPV